MKYVRLALERDLPRLVALEHRARTRAERTVVEIDDVRVEQELASELLGEGAATAFFYSIPNPHPPGDR